MQRNTSPQFNHGAHEILDVHEVLSASIGAMNQYTMLRPIVQDQELLDILDRQYQFMQQEYNTTVDCFHTGQDPAVPTQSYMMQQDNQIIYGLTPSQPKKPIQNETEISDEHISGFMLSCVKSLAALKTYAALEASNPVVRRVLADSVPNCIEMAYEISLYQNKNRFYQVPQLPVTDMQQMKQSYAPATGTTATS
ncbi:spore coat protein [Domibacillus epiphyticus]|uniref:Spore coat protein n=1 Tax=Domibacillus epiphyticus TaxID=1714355 RepID=A0A1V2A877_9BACI|nr:spore coat protein [Domibacillus epiphyticus]OMP67198.1 spore coat protein [Domibacillus epiphyticus]